MVAQGRTAPGPLRRMLWLLVALMIGLPVAGTVLFLISERNEVIGEATARTEDGARLLEQHFSRVFRVTDSVLIRAVALGSERPLAELRDDRATWDRLVAMTAGLPEPGQVFLVDAAGDVMMSTRAFDSPIVSIADRAHFTALRDGGQDFFVGPMVSLKIVDSRAFHVSRAIRAPDGTFLGAAVAGFEVATLTDFYATLSLGKGATIGLFGLDGRVILRQPAPQEMSTKTVAGGALLTAAAQAPHGMIRGISPFDGIERQTAYRVMPDYQLVVAVAIDPHEALSDWHRDALSVGLLLLAASACVAVMGRVAFRALGREERSMAGLELAVRQRTEEARQQAAEANRANASKTKFLAAASHDLRQPLQAAGMFVEVLAVKLAENSPAAAVVDKLRQSIDATQTLLTTLLDASTLEAGKVEPAPVAFPVAPLLANLADQMEPQATAAGLELRVVASSARIISDPVLLERILRNLLVNALRYTPHGKVLLGCRPRGDRLAICVIDTGIGIAADQHEAVFEDFTRLGDKETSGQRGLGLGLGVVRRTAALLGHEVGVRSAPAKGSCFSVVVPLVAKSVEPRRMAETSANTD